MEADAEMSATRVMNCMSMKGSGFIWKTVLEFGLDEVGCRVYIFQPRANRNTKPWNKLSKRVAVALFQKLGPHLHRMRGLVYEKLLHRHRGVIGRSRR